MEAFQKNYGSELAGCRSTLSMSKIKVKISETKFLLFYKMLKTSHLIDRHSAVQQGHLLTFDFKLESLK